MLSKIRAIGRWLEDRTGLGRLLGPLLRHPVPPDAKWSYVFGSAVLTAFLVQVVTGAALTSMYVPSTGQAYESLQFITHGTTVGRILRGMHYFGASVMITLMAVHVIRVFLSGAFKFPREMSWVSGTVLMLFVLGQGFTGQLLRWDQNAIWSVVVAAEQTGRVPLVGDFIARFILGGPTLGADTLSRFYSVHVFLLPTLLLAVVGFHVYLVFRNGISEPPKAGRPVDPKTYRSWYRDMLERRGVPFFPDALWRDMVFALLAIAVLVALAWHFGPPNLDRPPDPSLVKAHPKPDWYFLFYFALLALMPHGLENVAMTLGPVLVIVAFILLPFFAPYGERSPRKRPWAVATVIGTLTVLGALTVAGKNAHWSPIFDAAPLPDSVVASSDLQVQTGAQIFHDRACISCHRISGHGGRRGPELTHIGDLLTKEQMTIRILNGGYNMPAYGAILAPGELDALLAFLQSRH